MRTLKVYGTSRSANVNIFVNGNTFYPTDDILYSYSTEPEFHGAYDIKIQVFSGSIVLEKCSVDYPAYVNGSFTTITFDQPIESPLYKWTGETLIPQPFPIDMYRGIYEFKQLMFNGPNYFVVKVDDGLDYSSGLYVGNLITKEYIPELQTISPVYQYRQKDNNIWFEEDLHKLEREVIKNYGNNAGNP